MVSSGALGAAGSADLGLDTTPSGHLQSKHRREMRDRDQRRARDGINCFRTVCGAGRRRRRLRRDDPEPERENRLFWTGHHRLDKVPRSKCGRRRRRSATELQAGLDLAKAHPTTVILRRLACFDEQVRAVGEKKAQTVVRLFHEIDADRSGKLLLGARRFALDALAGTSARERR